MTLAIAQQLRAMLAAQGLTVVMTRDDDVALAGDDYPDLGCHGPPWRDVNGDGESGFDPEGAVRTRDELQARLDRSEEHTSELQSLMRLTYAVVCLKKKT